MSALADAVARVQERVRTALDGAPVDIGPPATESGDGATVSVVSVAAQREATGDRPALGVRLRCLVTPRAAAPWDELDALLEAFATDPCFDLSAEPPPLELWTVFGTPPRPALLVDLTARHVLTGPTVPRVSGPMRIEVVPVRTARGQVVGPGGIPVPGAVVRLERTGSRVTCDRNGRFQLTVPPGPTGRLGVELKGRTLVFEPPDPLEEPIVIRIDRLED